MTIRDISIEDRDGLLHTHAQRLAETQFADLRVSRAEQEDEGMILGAARWLAVCLIFVALAAVSVVFA